ncbi:DUF2897 family protein [Vibrio sp. JC009]|uniref:DUF2897 family protein n=1 Tax=Vibrio sp. JC009 TaxID=2912314 RepID=UPI0023B16BFD|nr:DUF2897 family protein [Vibrio sp. JC009]WED21131.1 DUF2897 family protein [Vibrio sp. JC009]
MVEFLTNPWVIILLVVGVVGGNIAALKYTAKVKFGPMGGPQSQKSDLDRLNELDKAAHPEKHQDTKKDA